MSFLLAAVLAATTTQSSKELAPGPGRETVRAVCTSCHTADLIVAARLSRKNWDQAITWMQQTQGMGPVEPGIRAAILDYLEKTQGPVDDATLTGSSPWAYPLYRPNPLW